MLFSSERKFRFWDYNISHKQLLLRSPISDDFVDNIDIVFWDVDYMAVPTYFTGIRLEHPVGEEVPSRMYSLITQNKQHLIVCSGCKVLRNKLDIFVSSLCYFAENQTLDKESLGEVLFHS